MGLVHNSPSPSSLVITSSIEEITCLWNSPHYGPWVNFFFFTISEFVCTNFIFCPWYLLQWNDMLLIALLSVCASWPLLLFTSFTMCLLQFNCPVPIHLWLYIPQFFTHCLPTTIWFCVMLILILCAYYYKLKQLYYILSQNCIFLRSSYNNDILLRTHGPYHRHKNTKSG